MAQFLLEHPLFQTNVPRSCFGIIALRKSFERKILTEKHQQMKKILSAALCVSLYACFPSREIQAEMVDATLVKVEVVNRYPNIKEKLLTWETDHSVSFVTYEPSSTEIPIGTRTKVLVPK